MPLLHCSKCHHEYEATDKKRPCDWCGAPPGEVLQEQTPLEKLVRVVCKHLVIADPPLDKK